MSVLFGDYSSVASTPSSSSQQGGLSVAQSDKDDSSSITSDSGVSTTSFDTLCYSEGEGAHNLKTKVRSHPPAKKQAKPIPTAHKRNLDQETRLLP